MEPAPDETTGAESFAYFMVRLRVDASAEASHLTGIVERLGSGRKQSFPDSRALLQLLTAWSQLPTNMQSNGDAGNAEATPDGSGPPAGPAIPDH